MVIQRWQSVLLLVVVVCMACFTFMSLGQVSTPGYELNFTTLGFSYEGEATNGAATGMMASTWIFFVVSLVSAIIPLITIFMFKNLKLQKTLCLVECLFIVAVIVIGACYGYDESLGAPVSWSSLAAAPFISLIADAMAYQRISADARTLRDADRLR